MACTKCHKSSCGGGCSVTRQIRVDNYKEGGSGGPGDGDLDDVAKRGNITELSLIAKPATEDRELATFGQVKQYAKAVGFEYIQPDINKHIEIPDSIMYISTITTDITIGALTALPGATGIVIINQDDLGGHVITLKADNKGGKIVLNTLPRAVTQLTWTRTDKDVYWKSEILDPGIKPTPVPTINLDDYYDFIEVFHSYNDSDIRMSVDGGPWVTYPGMFYIGPVDRPAGYWRFKIIEAEGRIESAIASSLPAHSVKSGFPYYLPLTFI